MNQSNFITSIGFCLLFITFFFKIISTSALKINGSLGLLLLAHWFVVILPDGFLLSAILLETT